MPGRANSSSSLRASAVARLALVAAALACVIALFAATPVDALFSSCSQWNTFCASTSTADCKIQTSQCLITAQGGFCGRCVCYIDLAQQNDVALTEAENIPLDTCKILLKTEPTTTLSGSAPATATATTKTSSGSTTSKSGAAPAVGASSVGAAAVGLAAVAVGMVLAM
ncbi:hypothetical protein DFJ73DRAFT_961239 [Zopfochytrium polystomum]|nr:hypothetical protein DFJ73DRAFT_961239 [Zopfochytrium polystomum]